MLRTRPKLSSSFESFAHRLRNYVTPADHACYRRTVRHLQGKRVARTPDPQKSVVFELTHPLVDRENGRYAYGLIKEFIEAGFEAYLPRNFWYLSSMERKWHKRLLLDEPVTLFDSTVEDWRPRLLVTDRSNSSLRGRAQRTLELDYHLRLASPAEALLFPYRPHPGWSAARDLPVAWPDLSDSERPVRVSFLGHWSRKHYDNERKLGEFAVLSRWKMINSLIEGLPASSVHVTRGPFLDVPGGGLLIGDDEHLPDMGTYAQLLRRSNFFLACPGTAFPMCHNLVESMLVGCIPIVQRPELTGMGLTPGVDCLSFRDSASLLEVVRDCFHMPAERIAALRASLGAVVERCLAQGSFARSLDLDQAAPLPPLSLYWFERSKRA